MICLICDGTGHLMDGIRVGGIMNWIIPCWKCQTHGVITPEGKPQFPFHGMMIHSHASEELMERIKKLSALDEGETKFSIKEFPNAADVAVKIGIFPSKSQARKNGWDKQLSVGDVLTWKKQNVKVIITD